MRMRLVAVLLVGLGCAMSALGQAKSENAPTCADLHLVPEVRECSEVRTLLVGIFENSISTATGKPDAEIQSDSVKSERAPLLGIGTLLPDPDGRDTRILLERASSSNGREILARNHLTFDAEMHDE